MVDPKLSEYVKTLIAQGKPNEEIYKDLLGQGQTIEAIQEIFSSIGSKRDKEDVSKKTIYVIVTIGAVLVGAGIFSFIASNWVEMSKTLKIVIILFSMIVSYSAGWHLKEKSGLHKTGNALIFLGTIIYGAGIFLVAQIFNIRANWPDGFILWMLGTIIMAYVVNLYPPFYLAILLGVIALIGHSIGFIFSFGSDVFLLTSSILLLIATIVTFVTGFVIRKKISAELKDFY